MGGVAPTSLVVLVRGALLDAVPLLALVEQGQFSLPLLFFLLPPSLELPLLEHGPFHVLRGKRFRFPLQLGLFLGQ